MTEADLGVNFFLDEASFGSSRAQRCTELLVELNPEVEGDWFPKNEVSTCLIEFSGGPSLSRVAMHRNRWTYQVFWAH